MKITFLHTSSTHINRFDKIVKKTDANIEIEHFVNEQLLVTALKTGNIDKEGFFNEIEKIKLGKFGKIICTCSTYGELCNEKEKIYRIDKPIAELIVSNYSNIGIAFTVNSTKEKSRELLKQVAKERGKQIKIQEINCQSCWSWFEKGDSDRYVFEIANQIKKNRRDSEVIFLAQASMEDAKKHLANEKYKTLSSPKYGTEKYIELFKNEGSG